MVGLSAGGSVALGVFVGLLSTSIQSVGLTLQRKSHLLEEEKEEHHVRRPPYRRRRWQLGMLMFIIANLVGSTIQITTLPLPVLSTLQASGLVFNSICASLILSEPFTRYSLFGTILVAVGAVLIGTFGALTEPSHTLDQLLDLLARPEFLVWLFATFFISILLFIAQWFMKRLFHRPSPLVRLLRGMCFGAMSGILSAHSLLVAKSAVELLVRTIVDRHNQFNRWQSWVILLGLVALALSQLYFLHRGLKLTSTSVLYPFVFCIYNIIAILDGLIYFRQASRLPVRDACLIAVGVVILLGGVACLSWRLEDKVPTAAGHQRKASRHSFTGVPPPRTALTPGLGFIDTGGSESDEQSPFLGPTHFDEESPLGISSGNKKRKSSHAAGVGPDEQTPLLTRANTAPFRTGDAGTFSQGREGRPRPANLSKLRRMTISEEAGEIWDELNDRTSPGNSLRSPLDSRGRGRGRAHARARSGTLPILHESGRRDSWWDKFALGSGKKPEAVPSPRMRSGAGTSDHEDDDPAAPLMSPSPPQRNPGWFRTIRIPRTRSGSDRQGSRGPFRMSWWGRNYPKSDSQDESPPERRNGDGAGGGDGR